MYIMLHAVAGFKEDKIVKINALICIVAFLLYAVPPMPFEFQPPLGAKVSLKMEPLALLSSLGVITYLLISSIIIIIKTGIMKIPKDDP